MRITIDRRLQKGLDTCFMEGDSNVVNRAIKQLDEYFSHKRKAFDIPLLMVGTDFQKTVWNELVNVSFGNTLSYKQLAEKIGNKNSLRAVARANGANAISIIVPCHRIIGSDGSLVGYAGGLRAKDKLLKLENDLHRHLSR